MDNADDTVKNTADLVTDKNNDDKTGLAELLSHAYLNREFYASRKYSSS